MVVVGVGVMGGGSYRAEAAIFPSGFVTQNVFTGLDLPTQVRFAPDGRVFIAEKNGRLLEFDSITDTSAKVVIDRSSAVYGWWDRGFLGLALDPDFSTSPYVYMLYTTDVVPYGDACPSPPGGNTDGCLANGRLSRVKVDAGSNLVGSEEVLLEGNWCQQYPSHSIGSLQFGDDGALYVSAGDGASFTFADWGQGGSAGSPTPENPCGDPPLPVGGQQQSPPNAEGGALRSQDLRTPGDPVSFDGTVLRVNKATGAAMPDNPLIGGDSGDDRIIAYGLRNPFRITARPGTNEIWVGDVGWSIWEEINRITSPTDATVENFGWPCYEGAGRNSAYDGSDLAICENLYGDAGAHTAPLFSFRHSSTMAGCAPGTSSLSGLAFYEGGDYPAEYNGALFIADYSRQCIWAMMPGADGEPSNLTLFADSTPSVALEIGPGGDLYSVDLLGGKVVRFRYPGANDAPTAVAGADRTAGQAPLTVAFDGTGSSDPDGDPMTYRWDLDGDGQYDDSTAVNPSFTYTTPGTYNVGLEVSDEWGGVDTDGVVITATTAPVATITSPSASSKWKVDQQVTFVGTGNDAEDGALPAGAMSWQLVIQHCSSPSSCHGHPLQQWTGVASGSFVAPDHEYPSYLELTLTVTDSVGATGSSTIRLDPATTVLSFTSTPAGLKLTVGGSEQVTPFTRTVIVGSQISVQAANPQTVNQRTYRFASWSDGGAAAHVMIAPANAITMTATFTGGYRGFFFDDEGSVHEPNIDAIANAGITKGCNPPANDMFCPGRRVTRGQMAAFLRRLLALPDAGVDYFTDDGGSTFEGDINALTAAGIGFGCTTTRFCPSGYLSRGEMAEFMVRAFDFDNPAGTDFFIDDTGSPFETSINALRANNITLGCNQTASNRFCPSSTLIRAQMASFLARALGIAS